MTLLERGPCIKAIRCTLRDFQKTRMHANLEGCPSASQVTLGRREALWRFNITENHANSLIRNFDVPE